MNFIINRWVRDEDFFGRGDLLKTIASRSNKATWVLGNRRVGKTSLLRQVEWLCRKGIWPDTLALFWDLQGAADGEGLKDALLESLEDAEEVAEALQLDVDELESLSLLSVMKVVRRRIKAEKQRRVMLLIDECEELVDVAKEEPNVLNSFRRLTQGDFNCTLLLAGSWRLMELDESDSRTSPLLPDFLPPLLLGPFAQAESLALLERCGIGADDGVAIHNLCFGNPHLLQVIGEHFSRLSDLNLVLQHLKTNKICEYFFQSNFQCLPPSLRGLWKAGDRVEQLARIQATDPNFPYLQQSCLLRCSSDGAVEVSPLLKLVSGEIAAAPISQESEKKTEPGDRSLDPVRMLLTFFTENPQRLLVLDPRLSETGQLAGLEKAKNPPSLNMMASLEESKPAIHGVLDGASPEYILGKNPTEKTAIYLIGLHLFRSFFGESPFSGEQDPWLRAGAISETDVVIDPTCATSAPLDAKMAMILTRCLKAQPAHRYPSLASLKGDLELA